MSGQRRGQEAGLQGLGHVGALAVLQRAVDGERDALRERLDEAPFLARGHAPRVAPAERQDSDGPPARHERDERGAAAQHGALVELPSVLQEDRLLGVQRAGHPRVAVHREQPPASIGHARIGACAPQVASEIDDVERAGVGDARHEQLGHLLERLVAAQRALEQRARVGQQSHAGVRGLARAARGLLDLEHPLQLALLRHALGDVARDDRHTLVRRAAQPPAGGLDRHARAVGALDLGAERLGRLESVADARQAPGHRAVHLRRQGGEDRRQRVELLRAAPREGLRRRVDVDHALAVEQHEGEAELALRAHERLVEVALLAQGLRRLGAIGHVGDGDADAQALAACERHRVVAGDVVAGAARLARRLADDLQVDDRLAGRQHLRQRGLDVGGHGGQDLAHRAAEVVDRRHAVDLGQRVVDAHVAEVGVEEALADRRRRDERVEQRPRLARRAFLRARLAVQPGVVDRERGARGDLPHEGDVVLRVAGPLAGAHERDRAQHVLARAQRHDQRRGQVERADELEMLGVARPFEELLLGDVRRTAAASPVRTTWATPRRARGSGG